MAKIFGQLEKAQIENLAADPASPSTGMVYFNTSTGVYRFWNGTVWKSVVTLDDTQTLTNKTISTANNTLLSGAATNGQVLTANGAGGTSWLAGAGGANVVTKTGAYTAVPGDVILANASAGAFTVSLPAAASSANAVVRLRKTDTTFNAVTLDPAGAELIDGVTTRTLNTAGEAVALYCDGSKWEVIEHNIPSNSISYTPVFAGFGAPTNIAVFWSRSGNTLDVIGHFTAGASTSTTAELGLPAGLAVGSGSLGATNYTIVGRWNNSRNGASQYKSGSILVQPAQTTLRFGIESEAAAISPFTTYGGDSFSASGVVLTVQARSIPIAGWWA